MKLGHAVYALHLLIILAGGGLAVRSGRLDRALVGLIGAMFGVSGLYLLLNAPYLALMQLLIYVGAVGVLIFFAIMLTGSGGIDSRADRKIPLKALAAGLIPALLLGIAAFAWLRQDRAAAPEIPVQDLGSGLLGSYALTFELISAVLFAAMAGAVLLAFEQRRKA